MKQRSIGLWQLVGFATTSLLGTLLHFVYEWSGGAVLAAPFSGVNESTWEHMKLLFWPMLLYAILQRFFFPDKKNYWYIQASSILLGLLLIPVLFYTYNGVIGKSPDWLNILIFFVAAAAAYGYGYQRLTRAATVDRPSLPALLALGALAGLFILFSFFPPPLGMFLDPTAG